MSSLLNLDEIKRLEMKIAAVERMTSAEFKIIICARAWFGIKSKARKLFKKYNLHKTVERNGVLILLVEKDREFLVYGDEGINSRVGERFWLDVKTAMADHFVVGNIATGLSLGLRLLADILVEHFPKKDEADELSNAIVFEK